MDTVARRRADNQNEFDCDAVRVAATDHKASAIQRASSFTSAHYVYSSAPSSRCPCAMPPTPASIISDALTSLSKATNLAVSSFLLAINRVR